VLIGPEDDAVVFDWQPTLTSGAELLAGPRGTDVRLEDHRRRSRSERREEFHARKDAQTAARDELAAERRAGHWASTDDEDDEG
jgi:GTP-binding protein